MSRPLKSSRWNGPIGQFKPFCTAVSMSSALATPSSSKRRASSEAAKRMRLTMKPQISFLSRLGVPGEIGDAADGDGARVAGQERALLCVLAEGGEHTLLGVEVFDDRLDDE